MLSLREPVCLANYLRRQENVCRLMYHDSRLTEVIRSITPVEGLVSQHPLLEVPISSRGSNAHEWQPHGVEIPYRRLVTVLPDEGVALPNMSVPLHSDAFSSVVHSHLAQPHGLCLQVRPNVITVLVPGVE